MPKVIEKVSPLHDPSKPPRLPEAPKQPQDGMMKAMEGMMSQCRDMMAMMAEGQDVSHETMKEMVKAIDKIEDRKIDVQVSNPVPKRSPLNVECEVMERDDEGLIKRWRITEK